MLHGQTQTKHFMLNAFYFLKNRDVYEIKLKNIVERDSPRITKWRMSIACWIPKATDTHKEYKILILFPRQKWLSKRA
jgi:hypothetical protein